MQEIVLKFVPSKSYIAGMSIALIFSIVIIGLLPWGLLAKLIAIFIIGIYGKVLLRRHGFLTHAQSIIKLMWHQGWYLENASQVFPIEIAGESTVTSQLCVLRYKTPKSRRKHSLLITRDMLAPDDYRRLIVALRNGI